MAIETRMLGRTGQAISVIGLGGLEVGRDWGIGQGEVTQRPSEDQAITFLQQVLDLGVRMVDTAAAYHQSEARIGMALEHRRAEYFLASKCGEHSREPHTYYDFSYEAIADSINQSLGRLRTDEIDLMQIHFGPEPAKVIKEGQTLRAMQDARDAGKVRYLGVSPEVEHLPQLIDSGDYDAVQVTYNLLDRSAEDEIKRAADHGLGVLVRFPLAMGWLTPRASDWIEQNPTQKSRLAPYLELVHGNYQELYRLALHFVARMPEVTSILVGTKNIDHLQQAVEAVSSAIDPDVMQVATKISR